MRACSETTSVAGWSGSPATLPRTAPSTRSPPLKKTLPSMRVVAPIRLSMRFCGLLSLRNMFTPCSAKRDASGHFGFRRPGLVDAQLNADDLGLRIHPKSPINPLEVLESQAERCVVRLPLPRDHDHSTAAALRQIDDQFESALKFLPAARPGREQ